MKSILTLLSVVCIASLGITGCCSTKQCPTTKACPATSKTCPATKKACPTPSTCCSTCQVNKTQ